MTLDSFVDSYHLHQSLNPNVCVALGIEQRLGELPDPSADAEVDRARSRAELLTQLEALESAPVARSADTALDLDLARLTLEAEAHEATLRFNGGTNAEQTPRAADAIGEGLFLLSMADPRPEAERLENVRQRVEAIPEYLRRAEQRLSTVVARWASMEQEKLQQLPTLLQSLSQWAQRARFAGTTALEQSVARATDALSAHGRILASLPSTPHFHVGRPCAEKVVALRGIELSLEQLHALARDFLAETRDTLDSLHQRLAPRYGLSRESTAQELHDRLNERFRLPPGSGDFEHVLERYREEQGRILAFVEARELFPIPKQQELRILKTPGFMEPSVPAGAMIPPAPFRAGAATSLVCLTLSAELLDEHTELGIPLMMIHEGIPGHHLQLATAARHSSTIRRHVSANDQAEGWTTLLEDYMLDQGYLERNAEEARFCAKRELSRIGARVAIDLYFMTGERDFLEVGLPLAAGERDPFVLAGNLLQQVTGFTAGRVQAELNWYSQERGYPLSYLAGNHLATQLLHDVRAHAAGGHPASSQEPRLRDGLSADRLFFKHYLQSGNMPLSRLRRAFANEGLVAAAQGSEVGAV